MAIISGMFNSINGDRRYNASWFAKYFATFIGNGVFPNPSTGLQVLKGESMTTTVKAGDGWIKGYFITNDSDYILQHDLADGVLKRIDRIVMRLNHLSRQIEVDIKKGTPASIPVAPSLQRDADAYELGLADVLINNGATQITQANITDHRLNNELCGIVHGVVDQVDTTTLFNQYQSWLAQQKDYYEENVENWTADQQADFLAWRQAETNGFNIWQANEKADFEDWVDSIRGILDENVAGNLQLQISDLQDYTNGVAEDLDEHKAQGLSREEGVHGIRFINKNLEYFDVETQEWKPASPPAQTIYGVEIDEGNPNPETSVVYTDDATGFTPSSGNNGDFSWGSWESIIKDEFRIRPVVLKNTGRGKARVSYRLQYDNYTKKADGSNSDLTGIDGDVMVEFGRPLWWRFARVGNKLKIQLSIEEFDGAIKPAFEIEDGYNQVSIYPLFLTQVLYLLMFKNLDSQTSLGRGNVDGLTDYLSTGGTNTKTFNYGETTGRLQMKFLGMEDFWSNRRWWIDGFKFDFERIIWLGKGEFNNLADGYENFGIASETDLSGYIDKVQGGNNTCFIPASTSGSGTTYYSDYGNLSGGQLFSFGGRMIDGSGAGGFHLRSTATSVSNAGIGGRLFYSRNGKIYIGAYLGVSQSIDNIDRLRSISGQTSHNNATLEAFRTLARENNH